MIKLLNSLKVKEKEKKKKKNLRETKMEIQHTKTYEIQQNSDIRINSSKCQKIGKTQQWPQDWKRSVFIPIPRKAMPKNAQTSAQLHSSHTLVK